ncbi:MAG: ABC-F family ATP-binding cassette domain-containing protein [Mycoplasmatales bacterium]
MFDNINLTINENDKIGIVGRNGVGKTTLLRIIENDDVATDGYVEYANHSVAFLSQEKQLNLDNTIKDEIKLMRSTYDRIYDEMQEIVSDLNFASDERLIKRYGQLETRYETLGGYEIESRIQKILGIFGFGLDVYDKKIIEFSGGEKTRLALVKIIMQDPDYLILDEPTNHLDVNTIEWLEEFLRLKAKGVVVVSHDRFFLQRVCNKIVEIEHGKIEIYKSNYNNFIKEKQIRYEYNLSSYLNQQDEIKRLEEFIAKNNGTPSKIGQVNDRKKKLEKMILLDKPLINTEKVSFEIEGFRHKKAHYVDLLDVNIGTDDGLVRDINFTVRGGDRIGIIGENGCGKSTLIKTMTKVIAPLTGNVILHPKINIGYFEQEQTMLDNEKTAYEMIEPLLIGETSTMIRKHLAKFLFKGKDVFKKVDVLSGGEKVRLIFAMFVLKRYDMIIMDEPTNHLDLSAKEELESVLKQYNGTLIVISHDRYFVNEVVNKIFYIEDGKYVVYDGNYEDFLKQKVSLKDNVKEVKQQKIRNVKTKVRNTKKLEASIELLENQVKELELLTLQPEVYNDWEKLNEINNKIKKIQIKLDDSYIILFGEE